MYSTEFSVVIPHFNRPLLLLRAIESVLAQELQDFEIIVVDDNSTLPLPHLPESVNIIRRQENGGGAAARNDGIRASKGRYLAFLDSDDYWLPARLARAHNAISSEKVRPKVIFYEDVCVKKQERLRVLYKSNLSPEGSVSRYILCHGLLQTSTLVVPNDGCLLFDQRLRRFQDLDFLVEAEKAGYRMHKITESNVVWDLTSDQNRLSRKADEYSANLFLQKHKEFLDEGASRSFQLQHLEYWRKSSRTFVSFVGRVLLSDLDWRRKASLIFH